MAPGAISDIMICQFSLVNLSVVEAVGVMVVCNCELWTSLDAVGKYVGARVGTSVYSAKPF